MTQEQTEEKIMKVAVRLFLEKGKDGTKTQEIAEKAGINKALLHYYFRTKEKLYYQVVKRELSKFLSGLGESIPMDEDFGVFLKKLIDLYLTRLAKNPQIIRFMIWELGKTDSLIEELIETLFLQSQYSPFLKIVDRIKKEIDRGAIRKMEPSHLIISIIGLCVYPYIGEKVLNLLFEGLDVCSNDFIETRSKEVYQLIWSGIANHDGPAV